MQEKIKIAIIGASGYTGHELIRLLSRHNNVIIEKISSESHIGKNISDLYDDLDFDQELVSLEDIKKTKLDLVFFTTPNNIANKHAKDFLENNISVIDFSADFRLNNNSDYQKYYGFTHKDEKLLESALYGLVEIKKNIISKLKKPFLIANPGCYTTAANLALAPVVSTDFFDKQSIIINAASGTSGAGRKFNEENTFVENFKAYNIAGKHRHTPEINMLLSELAQETIKVSFTPHLLPMFRGLQATIHINCKANFNYDEFYDYYKEFYKATNFVKVLEKGQLPETQNCYQNNLTLIALDYDPDTNRLIICSCIDNLVKGAAGQAVQNMNLAFQFSETEALL